MRAFHELQKDLVGETDLSVVLRKAKILAYKLENSDFKTWIESQLNGYGDAVANALPTLRILKTVAQGDFLNGAWKVSSQLIPLTRIPETNRSHFTDLWFALGS